MPTISRLQYPAIAVPLATVRVLDTHITDTWLSALRIATMKGIQRIHTLEEKLKTMQYV